MNNFICCVESCEDEARRGEAYVCTARVIGEGVVVTEDKQTTPQVPAYPLAGHGLPWGRCHQIWCICVFRWENAVCANQACELLFFCSSIESGWQKISALYRLLLHHTEEIITQRVRNVGARSLQQQTHTRRNNEKRKKKKEIRPTRQTCYLLPAHAMGRNGSINTILRELGAARTARALTRQDHAPLTTKRGHKCCVLRKSGAARRSPHPRRQNKKKNASVTTTRVHKRLII